LYSKSSKNSMCLAAVLIVVMEGCQTLAYVSWKSRFVGTSLKPNGTAVEGVCVTGAASRVLVSVVSKGTVPVASQYGAIFAITVRVGLITGAVQVVC
jgi:hypothetical protein